MILRPRYHAACRAEKRIASYCIYAKAVETGERYIALHGRYEKIRPDGGWRSSCAILNVAVRSWVLFFFETLCAITLREKRSIITQI